VGGSTGKQTGALPTFRTSIGQPYFSYAPNVAASGTRTRLSPAVFWYYKAFGAYAEYMQTTQSVLRTGVTRDVTNKAWEVTGSLVVTGEAASDRGVRPRANFDPTAGQWGALQIIARYSTLSLDDAIFQNALASTSSSHRAKAFAIGADWYPNPFIKYYVVYERTAFEGEPLRPTEHSIIFRAQVAF
jgi:phosphate-selective porin OprO/OprP